ncbi:unnamed protein product [Trichobilharzia regenti]|nr:unnamed protein product [Trichobilharzia regenti]
MPLPKHTVQPVKLSQVVVPNGVDNELEFVVNSTVCNVMRQIASISRLANNMFEELTNDLSRLVERTARLQNRLGKLHEDMQMALELPVFTMSCIFFNLFIVLNRNTIPPSMQSHYDQAEPAPALQQMDALRDDKKISMKLYSDPSFFFDLWSQEMLQDPKHKRTAKKKVSFDYFFCTGNSFFLMKMIHATIVFADPDRYSNRPYVTGLKSWALRSRNTFCSRYPKYQSTSTVVWAGRK